MTAGCFIAAAAATREKKLVRSVQELVYFKVHEQQENSNEEIDEQIGDKRVVEKELIVDFGVTLVGFRAVIEILKLVVGEENERQVGQGRHEPNENDQLERAPLCHERFGAERTTNDVVAFACDEQNGEYGRDAYAIFYERHQATPHLAQVPALFGEQIVQARGHTREEDHEVGHGQIGEQIVGKAAQLFLLEQNVYD
jgi:hypothetical protein